VPARIGNHVGCTTSAARRIGAREVRARGTVLKKRLGTFARKEDPEQREIHALMRSESSIAGALPSQSAKIEPLPTADATFDPTNAAECHERKADASCPFRNERQREVMEVAAGGDVAAECQVATVATKRMDPQPNSVNSEFVERGLERHVVRFVKEHPRRKSERVVHRDIRRAPRIERIAKCTNKRAIDFKPGILGALCEKMRWRQDGSEPLRYDEICDSFRNPICSQSGEVRQRV